MTDEPTPQCFYQLYEVIQNGRNWLADFDNLTGGEQEISMVKYNVIDPYGNVTTKYMPGQTSFAPVELYRPMDSAAEELWRKFEGAVAGKRKRKNYSISMNDHRNGGVPLVWWHLENALPIKIGGFEFNQYLNINYELFQISLQAEFITIEFVKAPQIS